MSATDDRDPLVSLSDVAELTGMTRSAVSNWRRRFEDFPEPAVGTATNPQFRFAAIRGWLEAHPGLGRGDTPTPSEASAVHLWSALNPHRGRVTTELGVEAMLCLIAWRHLLRGDVEGVSAAPFLARSPVDGRTVTDIFAGAVAAYEEVHPQHARLFQPLLDIDEDVLVDLRRVTRSLALAADDAKLFDEILDRYRRASGRGRGDWSTEPELATLLARLAEADQGDTIYDATAGVAETLVRAADAAEGAVVLLGQEINETAWRIATLRLLVHDLDGEIARGDTLRDDRFAGREADTVLIDAPIGRKWAAGTAFTDPRWAYGPPTGFADLAWPQHAIAHLRRDSSARGFVVLADAACFRRGNDARIRAALLRSGSIDAILALPTSLTPGTNVRRSIWVVNRPEGTRDPKHVLFADPATTAGPTADEHYLDALAEIYRSWRHGATDELHAPWARVVPVLELLGPEVDLTPSRWITPTPVNEPAQNLVPQLRDLASQANAALIEAAHLHPVSSDLLQPRLDRAKRLTIGQLVNDGLITVRRGRPKGRHVEGGDDGLPAITAASFRRDGALTTTTGDIGDDEWAQPGDVLVVTDMQIRALVAEQPVVPIAPVQVITITPQGGWIQPDYLAACLNSSWNRRFLTGSGIKHARLAHLEVAVATSEEQQAVVAFLRETHGAIDIATRLSDTLARLREQTMEALVGGAVTLQADPVQPAKDSDDDNLWFDDDLPGGRR